MNWEHSLKTGYYVRGSCILMRWSDGIHLVAHNGYDLDIGNTDRLSALINLNEQVHNVIPWQILPQFFGDLQWRIQGGAPSVHPPDENFLNFIQFLGKCVCWRLPLEGWRPLLRGILDPPMIYTRTLITWYNTRAWMKKSPLWNLVWESSSRCT